MQQKTAPAFLNHPSCFYDNSAAVHQDHGWPLYAICRLPGQTGYVHPRATEESMDGGWRGSERFGIHP